MNDFFLQANHIVKRYAAHTALNDVSISVPRGKVFGLLGPNGAGKTTLIRIINRITAPDSGEVLFDGHTFSADDVMRIGYLPEERGLYKKMKVGEQAIYLAQLKGLPKGEAIVRLKTWFEKFGIMPWWNKKLEELSKGMQQKVQFIITVLHEPPLLIFDEPFSGFDPVNAEMLKNEILALRDKGHTVIFSRRGVRRNSLDRSLTSSVVGRCTQHQGAFPHRGIRSHLTRRHTSQHAQHLHHQRAHTARRSAPLHTEQDRRCRQQPTVCCRGRTNQPALHQRANAHNARDIFTDRSTRHTSRPS